MRSNPAHQLFFIFQLENILRSNLNFSTSYGRLTDLKSLLGLLLVSFIWLGEKISKIYTYRWVEIRFQVNSMSLSYWLELKHSILHYSSITKQAFLLLSVVLLQVQCLGDFGSYWDLRFLNLDRASALLMVDLSNIYFVTELTQILHLDLKAFKPIRLLTRSNF